MNTELDNYTIPALDVEVRQWMRTNANRVRRFSFKKPDLDAAICKHPYFGVLLMYNSIRNQDDNYKRFWKSNIAKPDELDAVDNITHARYLLIEKGLIYEHLNSVLTGSNILKPEQMWKIGPIHDSKEDNYLMHVIYKRNNRFFIQRYDFEKLEHISDYENYKLGRFNSNTSNTKSHEITHVYNELNSLFEQILKSLSYPATLGFFKFICDSDFDLDHITELFDSDKDYRLFNLLTRNSKNPEIDYQRKLMAKCANIAEDKVIDLQSLGLSFKETVKMLKTSNHTNIQELELPELEVPIL